MNLDSSLSRLKSFARAPLAERCALCAAEIATVHAHVLDIEARALRCTCAACAILFSDGAANLRLITPRAQALPEFVLDDAAWEALAVPIGLAFFTRPDAKGAHVATFPSPAGPIESILPAGTWAALVGENPILDSLAPDTEALLVHRIGTARQYFLVSIDRCYELVGLIRAHWRGLSGGAYMQEIIARFFTELGGV